jgi:hypothetical protein
VCGCLVWVGVGFGWGGGGGGGGGGGPGAGAPRGCGWINGCVRACMPWTGMYARARPYMCARVHVCLRVDASVHVRECERAGVLHTSVSSPRHLVT